MHFFHVLNESSNHEDEVKVYRDIRKKTWELCLSQWTNDVGKIFHLEKQQNFLFSNHLHYRNHIQSRFVFDTQIISTFIPTTYSYSYSSYSRPWLKKLQCKFSFHILSNVIGKMFVGNERRSFKIYGQIRLGKYSVANLEI